MRWDMARCWPFGSVVLAYIIHPIGTAGEECVHFLRDGQGPSASSHVLSRQRSTSHGKWHHRHGHNSARLQKDREGNSYCWSVQKVRWRPFKRDHLHPLDVDVAIPIN